MEPIGPSEGPTGDKPRRPLSTRRRSRRHRSRPVYQPLQYVERFHADAAEELATIASWTDVTVSVQLPPSWLAGGRMPSLAPGDVRELAPALYMTEYVPVLDVERYLSGDDGEGDWWCSEAGTVTVRGGLVPPAPLNPDLQTFLLDVAGHLFPLNWTNPEPFVSPVIEATGGLYLDPRLERGGQLGPTGDWCRAVWRVSGLRRFPVVDGETRDAVTIDRTPDPWDVEVESTYVVDLVAADRD